ncbi:MAG: efflux RND transporter periplasmic adaptor subunit [Myxococcota bacterium]
MRRVIIGFVVAVVVLGGLLGWQVIAQSLALLAPAGGSGVIEGTTVRASSRVGGRIVALPHAEGEAVEAGTVLVQLDCIEARAGLAEAEARVVAAEQQAAAAERVAGAASQSAGAASQSARAASAQARALTAQSQSAVRESERLGSVSTDVSQALQDRARFGAEGAMASVEAADAQRQAGRAQARAASSQAEAAAAQAEAAQSQVEAARAALERAKLAVSECDVTAPIAGTVQLLPWEVGELVPPGATLATVVDIREARAAFYLPNADLASARMGEAAEVRADAWPGKVFDGRITEVATEAEFTPRNIQTRTDRDRLVYRVEVEIHNPDGELRPGMPVEVVLLERE